MRSEYRCLARLAAGALGSILLALSLAAQEHPLPMGRSIGAACTRSVDVPAPAGAPGPGSGPARAPGQGPPGAAPAAGPGAAVGQGPPPFASNLTPAEATKLVKVRDDVYAVVNVNNAVLPDIPLFGGNVGIYLTDGGVVLVDSKNERMHDDLVAKVRSLLPHRSRTSC